MKIKGKTVYVYDIEVFPNCFHCSIKHTKTKERYHFEISERKNQYLELYKFFTDTKDKLFCGYNNIHYDNPIINYLIDKFSIFSIAPWSQICLDVKDLSDLIITSETSASWRKWKYAKNFETLDLLTMLFSQKLRVGLKEMQVTMQFRNVQEYEGDFQKPIPLQDIDKMIGYNDNDVDSTEELLFRCVDQIKLRLGIQKEYGIDVLSMDGVSIGKEILKTRYLQDTGKTWDEIKDLRSPCDIVDLKDVILDKISYSDSILQNLLCEMKTLSVNPGREGWNKHFLFHGQEISIGVGGLHSINKPEKITVAEDEILIDGDAKSLYPSLLIEYGFYPKHLGKEFVSTYKKIRDERFEAKQNKNKVKDETLKLALNAVTGLMQSEYSWMYSPQDVMKIRMNGQLFLLKLADMLYSKMNCYIFNWNTDGLFIKFKKKDLDTFNQILKDFEKFSQLIMEVDEFEGMYQFAVNDYIAIKKGYSETKNSKLIKQKGMFISEVSLGKGMQAMIIPKALNEYFINNIPVENTIKSSRDIHDFITYQKVSKEFSVEYNGNLVSHINRYYVSKLAPYLFKCKVQRADKYERWIRFKYLNEFAYSVTDDQFSIPKYTIIECPEWKLQFNGEYYMDEHVQLDSIEYFDKLIEKGCRTGYINMLKGHGVRIINDLTTLTEFPTDIDYDYYISECKKIINQFECKQLSLF